MKAKQNVMLLVAAVSLPLTLAIAWQLSRPKMFQATAVVLVSRTTNEDSAFWSSNLQFETLSNLLSRTETIRQIAGMSGVNPSKFGLRSVRPVRDTMFVQVWYYGSSSNGTVCVASNASEIMADFYRTNFLYANATNFGARIYEPPPFWHYPLYRLKYELSNLFP